MKTTRLLLAAIATTALAIVACASNPPSTPDPSMLGHWTGDAKIIVAWAKQKHLPVALEIHPDSTVTGTVGDATLTNATLLPNRGAVGRQLNLATDYIITGDLTGPVITAEHITRNHVNIPLNFKTGTFTGGLHTSGTKFGGKDKMVLSAASLQLSLQSPTENN